MTIQYKSSIASTYFYYFIYIIIIVLSLFFAYKSYTFSLNDNSMNGFNVFFIPLMIWFSIISIIKFFKLKYVEVNDDNILMSSLMRKKVLNYKDIEWVHINSGKIANEGSIILIKYKNANTGKFNIIYFLPETEIKTNGISSETLSKELEMTKYIKEKIVSANLDHNNINEPFGWYVDKIYYIALIPTVLVFIYLLF